MGVVLFLGKFFCCRLFVGMDGLMWLFGLLVEKKNGIVEVNFFKVFSDFLFI